MNTRESTPKRRRLVRQVPASPMVMAFDDVVRTPDPVSELVVSVTAWGVIDGPK